MGASESTLVELSSYHQTLLTTLIPATNTDFWEKLWTLPSSIDDIVQIFPLSTIRVLCHRAPQNIISFLWRLIYQIRTILLTTRKSNSLVSSTPPSNDAKRFMNCIRILTRLLSVLLEEATDQWTIQLFWSVPSATTTTAAAGSDAPKDGKIEENGGVPSPFSPLGRVGDGYDDLPLGEIIVRSLSDSLFLPGISIGEPVSRSLHYGVQLGRSWDTCILPPGSSYVGKQAGLWGDLYDDNRIEIIKCLLSCFSEGIFLSAQDYKHGYNPFLSVMVSEGHLIAPTLFFSLLSIICSTESSYASSWLPFSSTSINTEKREALITSSIQLLLVLIDYRPLNGLEAGGTNHLDALSAVAEPAPHIPRSSPSIDNDNTASSSSSSSDGKKVSDSANPPFENIFRRLLFSLVDSHRLSLLYLGLLSLLNQSLPTQNNSWLSFSSVIAGKESKCYQEVFILLWKLIDEHPCFLPFLLSSPPSSNPGTPSLLITSSTNFLPSTALLELLHPILYYLYKSREDASKLGLLYTCVFILLKLSGERDFACLLNNEINHLLPHTNNSSNAGGVPLPLPPHTPTVLPLAALDLPANFNGSYADLLLLVSHKLIVSSPSHLDALLKVLLTLLANVSPYITRLSLLSSVKLLNLFELFSSPRFMFANETNSSYVSLLLDFFNNAIQYQYAGHSALVYCIIRRSKLFYQLGKVPDANNSDTKSEHDNKTVPPSQSSTSSSSSTSSASGEKSKFIASASFIADVKRRLPLEPIYRVLEFFLPKIEALAKSGPMTDEKRAIELIQRTTLVGVLPIPHSIIVRRYIQNAYTSLWFTCYLWGAIFLASQTAYPQWDARKIKMFAISITNNDGDDLSDTDEQVNEDEIYRYYTNPDDGLSPSPSDNDDSQPTTKSEDLAPELVYAADAEEAVVAIDVIQQNASRRNSSIEPQKK